MICYKFILINTWFFQMIKKEVWVISMILLIYFLKHKIVWFENAGLTDKEESTDKEGSTDWRPMLAQQSDKVKAGKH